MGSPGKNSKLPEKDGGKPKDPPPKPLDDDDFEDGDFATPKRDRDDDENEPL
jgi:hypothetical protein